MDCGESGMNLVAITISCPRKEYWPSRESNQRPLVLKPSTPPIDLYEVGRPFRDLNVKFDCLVIGWNKVVGHVHP